MAISVGNSEVNYCRTCLNANCRMHHIFTEQEETLSIASIISICTSLQVEKEDSLPKQICDNCYNILISFYNFQKQAKDLDIQLRQQISEEIFLINNTPIKQELSESDNDTNEFNYEICIENLDNNNETKDQTQSKDENDGLKRRRLKLKDDETFTCPICSEVIKQHKHYINHLLTHDTKPEINQNEVNINTTVTCEVCSANFKSINSLAAHKRKHVEKGRVLSCNYCCKVFKKLSHLKRHEMCHENSFPNKCTLCRRTFITEELLKEHINKHKGVRPYACPVCNKRFSQRTSLTSHLKAHAREKPYLCATCGKRFDSKTNWTQHARRHIGLKMFDCDLCPKKFITKGELQSHKTTHTGEKAFTCKHCGATFTKRASLNKHNFNHLGIKPYQCDVCPMKFTRKYYLTNHYRIHTGEKPFRCEICDCPFRQSGDLLKHRRVHLGVNLYKCNECGEGFRLKSLLRQHLSEHYVSTKDTKAETKTVADKGDNQSFVQIDW